MDFKAVQTGPLTTARTVKKASATVIEAGDAVALDTGLLIKATATSAAIGWAPSGAGDGETTCVVMSGPDLVLEGTGDANYAVTMQGTEVDIVVTSTVQLIDVGSSATDVFKIDYGTLAGTAGAATGIRVRINKPL